MLACGKYSTRVLSPQRQGQESLFVLPGRAVDAAGAVGSGAAPDALVGAGAMAVLARGRVDASGTVARRTAPFAVLLVIAVFMFPRG